MTFLIVTIIKLYIKFLLLLIWMNVVNYNKENFISQFILNSTNPILEYFRSFLNFKKDISLIIFISYIFSTFLTFIIFITEKQLLFFNFSLLIFSFLSLLKTFSILLFWLMTSRSVIKWFNLKFINFFLLHDFIFELTDPFIKKIHNFLKLQISIEILEIIIILSLYFLNFSCTVFIPKWKLI